MNKNKVYWTRRQIGTLRHVSKHGINLKMMQGIHQGTLGSLLSAGALNSHGLTRYGLEILESYSTPELSARAAPADLTARVQHLLKLVRSRSAAA